MATSRASVPSPRLDEVEGIVRELVQNTTLATGSTRGRPPILPALMLWTGLLVCILRGFSSQLDLWRLLQSGRFWDFPAVPISDQAVYHRLARSDTTVVERLFAQVSSLLAERLAPLADQELAPFAQCVVAIDETRLDPVARRLPSLRGVPTEATIPGKLAGRFDLRTQQWQTLHFEPQIRQNEKVRARELVADLPTGSLILADLGYFGFAWFDELTAAGQYWISRLRDKTSYRIVHVLYRDGKVLDALIWLGTHRADRARFLVRLVQIPRGKQVHQYITNVTDPQQLSMAETARIYARRWDIEMAVQLVKQHLGLHLLWSSKPVVIQQQIWAVLIIAQLAQALRMEAAARAGVDLFDVSLPLLLRYLPRYANAGHDPLAAFLADGKALGFIRPSRRVRIEAPEVPPEAYHPPPPDLQWERTPRNAHRKAGPR